MSEKIIKLIFGKRGSGKSYLAKKEVQVCKRLLIYDTLGEYTEGVVVESLIELKTFWTKVYAGNFRLIYRPLDPPAEFDVICDLVWELGDMTFLVEEIDCFCSVQSLGPSFKAIIQRGRHKDVTLIGITQRPASVARLLTSQAKEICIFNTNEPRDIKYFSELIGEAIVPKIAALGQYEYVIWRDGVDELIVVKA